MSCITIYGKKVHIYGALPQVGTVAPDFAVTKTDLSEINLENYRGNNIILNVFTSLDTSTCAKTMLQFNKIAEENSDILILCVSADLPFAQKRFCSAQHLDNIQPVSTFRHPSFGTTYGLEILDGEYKGLLARAVIFVNKNGIITYSELVNELADEPNYDKLIEVIA